MKRMKPETKARWKDFLLLWVLITVPSLSVQYLVEYFNRQWWTGIVIPLLIGAAIIIYARFSFRQGYEQGYLNGHMDGSNFQSIANQYWGDSND